MEYILSIFILIETIILLYIFNKIISLKKKSSIGVFKGILSLNTLRKEVDEYCDDIIKQRDELDSLDKELELLHEKLNMKIVYLGKLKKSKE